MEAAAAASSLSAMETIDSGCSTPYMTAPSSPPRLPFFDHNPSLKDANFALPPPSSPKHFPDDQQLDFAFHFSGIFHDAPLSAEDLFHHGKIKPLKTLQPQNIVDLSTESDAEGGVIFKTANSSPRRRNVFHDAFSFSPRKRKDVDLAPSSHEDVGRRRQFNPNWPEIDENSTFKLTKSRSLSPFQVSDMLFDDDGDDKIKQSKAKTPIKSTTTSSFWNSLSFTKAYRKWKLKDLLFRSASEGRSADKVAVDPALMNYTILPKSKKREDRNQVKAASSFRSSSNGSSSMKDSSSGSGRNRSGVPVSAHELHYTVNRAVSEEMRRKTFLPYKQSLLGCLGFNPGGHDFTSRVGSITRV